MFQKILVCNLLQFAPNFWFLKRHVYIYVLFVRVLKTDLFLNDSTVKQKWNWSLSRHDMTRSEADTKIP